MRTGVERLCTLAMYPSLRSRRRHVAAASISAAGLAIGTLAVTAGPPTRAALLQQLARPASFRPAAMKVGPGPVNTSALVGPYRVVVRLSPNRAGRRDALQLRLTRAGARSDHARAIVSFSMPSMNMWQVLTSQLRPGGRGVYAADEPVLGMPGTWQLSVRITPSDGVAFTLVLDDHMGA
jgi:hypothetical protein